MLATDERTVLPRNFLLDREVMRALVAANMDDVPIALGGDHAGRRAFVF